MSTNIKFKTLDGFNSTGDVVVGANTLTVDTSSERVGIKKGNPQHPLDINGTVAATLFSGSGASLTNVDAATLVGSANYLRSDVATTYTGSGNFTFNSTGTLRIQTGQIRLDNDRLLRFGTVNSPGVSMKFNSANNTMIVEGSNTTFIGNGGTFFRRGENQHGLRLFANSAANTNTLTITSEALSSNATVVFQGSSGTVALLSDLPVVGNGKLTVTGSTGLTGTGDFFANQTANTTITLTNSDRGSTQNIFKQIGNAGGTQQFVASNNNDMLRFAASGATSVSFDNNSKTVTYSSTDTTYNLISQAEVQGASNTNERLISGQRFQDGLNTDRLVTGNWTFRAASNSQRIRIQGNSTTNANTMTITTETLTANRTVTLPNISGTAVVTSDTNGAVMASTGSTASGDRSAVIASSSTTASGARSIVLGGELCSATGNRSGVISSSSGQALGAGCVVIGTAGGGVANGSSSGIYSSSFFPQADGINSVVVASNRIINNVNNSLAMGVGVGVTGTAADSTIENRKIHLFSENGNIYNDGELRFGNLNWSSSTPAGGWALSVTGGVAGNNTNNGNLRFLNGTTEHVQFANTGVTVSQALSVGPAALGTTGEIRATGNITAFFSDERLKTFKGIIESPLEKINSLNGYHYELNELAESFGYSDNKQYVGVSAQEVEAVLPEVVSLAPFDADFDENGKEYSKSGENYKTVDYSKLVVLLIEGMKEQQNEIQQLKETVNHLKTIIG